MVLLHASFRSRLTTAPLRFTSPSPPSGWTGDFHPRAAEHARHTIKKPPRAVLLNSIQTTNYALNVRFRSIGLQTPEFIRTSYGYVTGSDFSRQTAISCCPVNSGLTYRLPSAKFVHSGNFGGCGLVPLLLLQEAWACLLPVRTGGTPEFESG